MIAGILFVVCFGVLFWINEQVPLDIDDAYITYRYARNIATGNGFTYNPGEPVLGTSTPLFTLLLAGFGFLGFDIPGTSSYLNLLAATAAVAMAFLWIQRLSRSVFAGLFASALLFTFGPFLASSISGMESGVYVCLIMATFFLYDAGRLAPAAVLAALCVLMRLDGLAVGAALLAHYVFENRRFPTPGIVTGYCLPLLPWFSFSLLYFGQLVPQSMIAKHAHVLVVGGRWWMPEFLMQDRVLYLLVPAVLGLLAGPGKGRRSAGIPALILWSIFYASAFTVYRIDRYPWYLAPMAISLSILPAYGTSRILREIFFASGAKRSACRVGGMVLCCVVMSALFFRVQVGELRRTIRGCIHYSSTMEMARTEIAKVILAEGSPEDTIRAGAIGIVGWQTRCSIRDLMGLVSKLSPANARTASPADADAKWLLLAANRDAKEFPTRPNFKLFRTSIRNSRRILLLYRRADPDRNETVGWDAVDLKLTNGLELKVERLSGRELQIDLAAEKAVAEDFKYFVEVDGGSNRKVSPRRIYDFYPVPPTRRMEPGKIYRQTLRFPDPLPSRGAVIRLGLFSPFAPFPRLGDANGRDHVELVYHGESQ
ncbi:MAG: hypothetical protein GY856_06660 [bacterium]|nr:hypothetical protein [bacterium]